MRNRQSNTRSSKFSFEVATKPIQDSFRRRQLAKEANRLLTSAGLCWDGRPKGDHHSVTIIPNSNGPRH
jgi:hypothetical protein